MQSTDRPGPQGSNWTGGYVSSVDYTLAYHGFLNPVRLPSALLDAGYRLPNVQTACELGFGQGASVIIHSAATPCRWYGTDFNPAHAALAQKMVVEAGSGANLYDQSFAEFCTRPDLPDFDFISLHGVWTWISDENRQIIVDFVRRKLRVGGVLFISYNCLPGWAGMISIQQLLARHAELMTPSAQGLVAGVTNGITYLDNLLGLSPIFTSAYPVVHGKIKEMATDDLRYVTHEYLNKNWNPMSFGQISDWLDAAKISFVTSSVLFDRIPKLNYSTEQQNLLNEIADPLFRQMVQDFMINAQFRRDYWVKGPLRLSAAERLEAIRQRRVVLVAHRPDVALKLRSPLGEVNLVPSVNDPILDLLADHRPKSIGQIVDAMAAHGLQFPGVYEALLLLEGKGDLMPVQTDEAQAAAAVSAAKFNRHVIDRARLNAEWSYLASPVTGGGFTVARPYQLFIGALARGEKNPEAWAKSAWQVLSAQGELLVKDGKPVESPEENLAQLTGFAREFSEKALPILRMLKVIE